MQKLLLTAAAVGALSIVGSANAAVFMGELTGGSAFANGGAFQQLNPIAGFNVGNNNQQSNNLFAFDEQQGVTLLSAIGSIAAGTIVNSHYVFFDPGRSRRAIGYVDFDGDILGVLDSRSDMEMTDALLGNANANYVSVNLRGLEAPDSFNIMGDRININFRASSPGDYIRVLTAASAVPEPSTWAMMIGGFGLVGGAMRRRRKVSTKVSYA